MCSSRVQAGSEDELFLCGTGEERSDLEEVDAASAELKLLHNAAAAAAATPRAPADSRRQPPAAGLGALDLYLSQSPVFSTELSGRSHFHQHFGGSFLVSCPCNASCLPLPKTHR